MTSWLSAQRWQKDSSCFSPVPLYSIPRMCVPIFSQKPKFSQRRNLNVIDVPVKHQKCFSAEFCLPMTSLSMLRTPIAAHIRNLVIQPRTSVSIPQDDGFVFERLPRELPPIYLISAVFSPLNPKEYLSLLDKYDCSH